MDQVEEQNRRRRKPGAVGQAVVLALIASLVSCGPGGFAVEATVKAIKTPCITMTGGGISGNIAGGVATYSGSAMTAKVNPDPGVDSAGNPIDCPQIAGVTGTFYNDHAPGDDQPQPDEISDEGATVSSEGGAPSDCVTIGAVSAEFGLGGQTNPRYEYVIVLTDGTKLRTTGALPQS